MIVRAWHATATAEGADAYREHFTHAVLPALQPIDGYRGAYLLRRDHDGHVELQVLTVWDSLEALQQFVYSSAHVGPLRDRKQWFEPLDGPILALWWIPVGHILTVAEAKERLELLKERGPSPDAFTFRTPFPNPDAQAGDVAGLDARFCEWAT